MGSVFTASNTAVITGGASGIGLAVARKCHGHGMRVLVADRDASLLNVVKDSVGEGVTTFEMDVGKIADWERLKQQIADDFGGRIDLLMLNAGIGSKSSWEDIGSFHKLIETNLYGVVNGISTLLPLVGTGASSSSKSAIVITGSKQGITNPPGNFAYNASKSAVKTVAEHLAYDLRATPTTVHLLVPGWTFTGLSGGAPGSTAEKPPGAWTPQQVADFMEEKMEAGQFYIICPDNEVTEIVDRKRILWSAGDLVYGRPPLSRWRPEFTDEAKEWMAKQSL